MKALKLKIFDVLTERTPVSKFENWLYGSEELMSQLNSNSFYFDVISINYKNGKWDLELNNLAKKYLDCNCLEILDIKKICLQILESDTLEKTHEILRILSHDFNYDTNYSILWKLYALRDYFDLVEDGIYKVGTLQNEAKFYSKQTLEIIKKFENFDELKFMLEEDLKPYKILISKQKSTLKQKIFAFLKKI